MEICGRSPLIHACLGESCQWVLWTFYSPFDEPFGCLKPVEAVPPSLRFPLCGHGCSAHPKLLWSTVWKGTSCDVSTAVACQGKLTATPSTPLYCIVIRISILISICKTQCNKSLLIIRSPGLMPCMQHVQHLWQLRGNNQNVQSQPRQSVRSKSESYSDLASNLNRAPCTAMHRRGVEAAGKARHCSRLR